MQVCWPFVSSSFTRLCQTHRRPANELLPICADIGRFLAPVSEVLVQMVDTFASDKQPEGTQLGMKKGEKTATFRGYYHK